MSLNILKIFIIFELINKYHTYIVLSINGNNPYELLNKTIRKSFTEDFLYSSIYNNIYTLIGIGNPNQNIIVNIIPTQKDFLFSTKNCELFYNNKYINKNKLGFNNVTIHINSSKIGYTKNNSKSFFKNELIKLDSSYNINFFCGKERLKLDDYRNILIKKEFVEEEIIYPHSQSNLINFSFVYEETINEICGSIGLAPYNNKNNNKFIEQIKTSNIIQNYYWNINYISLDKGFITIGILPHQYLNTEENKKYNYSNFVEIYNNFALGNNHWAIEFDELFFYSDNKMKNEKININIGVNADFSFTKQIIVGSLNYKKLIIVYFFQEYINKNICIEESFSNNINYSIIKCYKRPFEKELIKFPELYLYKKEFQTNFCLSYKDLFITLEENIYFLIIFRTPILQQINEIWELGIPFLKKYQIIFNSDTKKIGYYISKNISNEIIRKDIKRNNNVVFSFRTFLELFVGFIFILLIIFLLKNIYYNKIKQQKRPYELQDEYYDYFSKNNEMKKEYIIDINSSYENKIMNKAIEMKIN